MMDKCTALAALINIVYVVGVQSTNDDQRIVFLERGRRGLVPFPPIPSLDITTEDIDASYWYHPGSGSSDLLISFFLGSIGPQNGIPEGVYDINEDFSLVIENVTNSDEGNYYLKIKPMDGMVLEAGVVTVKVKDFITRPTLYLERGVKGVVPCPASSELELTPEDIQAVYWYDRVIGVGTPSTINNFNDNIILGPGVPPGMYDIDEDFKLVIHQVLDLSAIKTYYCWLLLNGRPSQEGSVPVEVIVYPRTENPIVSPSGNCVISVPANQDIINLTCTAQTAKPAVSLEFRRLNHVNESEVIPLATVNIEPITIPSNNNLTDSEILRINNTFTTTVSVNVEVATGFNYFKCISSSKPHWPQSGEPSTIVTVYRADFDDDQRTAFLERGRRGILPFPPIPSLDITTEDIDAAYWYHPRLGSRDLIISYFLGSIAPQNGISEGVYDINEDFSIVIENVTDSDEGKYYFRIKPRYGMVLNADVVTLKVRDVRPTLHLERGVRGVVTCPAASELELTPEDIQAVYWYDRIIGVRTPSTINNFDDNIILGQGVLPGMYDIDEDFNLVINQVLDSSAKTYYCRLDINGCPSREGSVTVEVIVFPRTENPVVSPCDKKISNVCEIYIPVIQDTINLTCTFRNAKPSVGLKMINLNHDDYSLQVIPLGIIKIEPIIIPSNNNLTDSEILRINNTFTTTASVTVEVAIGFNFFMCISSSKAHWSKRNPGTFVTILRAEFEPEISTVTIPKDQTITHLTTPMPSSKVNILPVIMILIIVFAVFLISVPLFAIIRKRITRSKTTCKEEEEETMYKDSEIQMMSKRDERVQPHTGVIQTI